MGKRLLFHIVTVVLFFGALEIVLALFGVKSVIVDQDPYVGFARSFELFEPTSSGEELKTATNKLALFNEQVFSRTKKRDTFRIFTLGGSVTYGRPFDDSTSFSAWLRAYLKALGKDKKWEVINAGGISYASYRVATLMEELVTYDPDLFIIYSGHNEFLEKRTYGDIIAEPEALTRTKMMLQRTRLWSLGRSVVSRTRSRAEQRYELTGEVEELLDSSAGLDYYHRDDAFKRRVLDHYRFNLQRMTELARASGAEIIFVSVPVNEKDFSPFKSQHRDDIGEDERTLHAGLLADAALALEEDRPEEARELAAQAVEIDELFAQGHYLLGRALLELGLHQEARISFDRAIEEDVCPLRALAETNAAIVETARRNQLPLVDYRGLLQSRMKELEGHPLLGDELFLDHAHPTVEANGILARALVEQLAEMGHVELEAEWHQTLGPGVRSEMMARVDTEAQARAYKNLSKVLIWAGKKKEAEKYVALASDVLENDWEIHYNEGSVLLDAEDYDQAIESLRKAIRLNPGSAASHDLLGLAYARSGQPDAAVEAGLLAVSADPRMPGAWNNLSTSYGAVGNQRSALEAAREAIRLKPDFAEAHNNLGKVYFDLGMLSKALASYESAMEYRPSYVDAMMNRGLVLGELGRYREALDAFSEALRLEPGLPEALLGRAKALLGLGDWVAADSALETVISLDEHRVEAYELLALDLLEGGHTGRATEVLERGLGANPDAARLHHLKGRVLVQEARYDAASDSLLTAIELDPSLLAARVDLGSMLMAQGRHQDAVLVFEEALALDEDDHRLHHILATALLVSDRVAEARTHLEEALRLDPDNAMAANDLAAVCERLGQLNRALELYRRASHLDPELESARQGAARLAAPSDPQ